MTRMYTDAATRFPPDVDRLLRDAGWYPGRREPALVASWADELARCGGFTMPESVRRALEEFGGIGVLEWRPGHEIARAPFKLVPVGLGHQADEFAAYASVTEAGCLYPIGEVGNGHGDLAMDEKGRVYMIFSGSVFLVGESMETALTALLLGLRLAELNPQGA